MDTQLGLNIKRLRQQGLSYNAISEQLGCSKGTVSYHLGTSQKAKARSRRLLRKDKINKLQQSKRAYLQELAQRYKRKCGCRICGIKNPIVLQFDHIDPTTKISTVSQMITDRHNIERIKAEIRKCQILCANCHLIKTAKDFNYKKY